MYFSIKIYQPWKIDNQMTRWGIAPSILSKPIWIESESKFVFLDVAKVNSHLFLEYLPVVAQSAPEHVLHNLAEKYPYQRV